MNAHNEDPGTEPRGILQTVLLMIVFVGCVIEIWIEEFWWWVRGRK